MKLLIVLSVVACAFAAAAPETENTSDLPRAPTNGNPPLENTEVFSLDPETHVTPENRSILMDLLMRQLVAFVRRIINNGSPIFNIPPLDPLKLEHFEFEVPLGIFNAELELRDALMSGIGEFEVHVLKLSISDLYLDLDISVPKILISSEEYNFVGDLFTAIPLYGNGRAEFELENFRFALKIHLAQSEDGTSAIIDHIENLTFEFPGFKSKLTGVIGGGTIDEIVNAIIEDVVMDYINRFRGVISKVVVAAVTRIANPILGQLNTWKYIEMLQRG